MWVYFWALYSVTLFHLFVFVLIPHCFYCCSFAVLSEVWENYASWFVLLSSGSLCQLCVIYGSITKVRLKLKKVGKTTRPFRYDLNQILCDYTVEVWNRFKGLDLIDRVPDELWMEVRDTVHETGIKTIPMEKKCKKAKWLSGESLQIAVKRREVKSKGEKERHKHLNVEFQDSKER